MSSKYGGVPVQKQSKYGGIPSDGSKVGFKPAMAAPFETALQVASSAIAQPVSGLVGLLSSVVPGAPPAGKVVRDVQNAMTYQPRTEEGRAMIPNAIEGVANMIPQPVKDAASSVASGYKNFAGNIADRYGPAAGAAVATAPTAVLEAIPGAMALRKLNRAGAPEPPQNLPVQPPTPEVPPAQQYQNIGNDMRSGRPERIAPAVQPDMQILKDAEALGIDLNPSHYSTNRAYIDLEQSLKSRPGSLLQTNEERAIINLGNKADELIDSFGGSADKSVLDSAVMGEFNFTMGNLNQQSDALYEKVNQAIPRATRVMPNQTRSFIESQIAELGGDESLLTSAEKSLLRFTKKGQDGAPVNPTYAAVDRVRKDIGSAIGSRSGPFKDDDAGQLRRLYEVLAQDQQNFADAFGVGAEYKDAQGLVRQRKLLEDRAVSVFGRELGGSLIPKLRQAGNSLTQGDISKLKSMMDAVPEPRRQDVAATLLNDLFASGARRNAPIGQGFVNAFAGLNRNPRAKAELFKYLPQGAEDRFNAIGRVATGIYRAKALENSSRTARDIISALDSGGWLNKMYGLGKKVAAAEGVTSAIGIPGAGTAGVIGGVLSKGASSATKAADELLISPAFKEAVIESAVGNGAAQKRLLNSPQYNAWLDAQNPNIKTEIGAIGFIPWLTRQEEEQQ